MRTRITLLIIVAAALAVPATAAADFQHTVAPGESLSSVAAADGMSVSQLAAVNGLSSASQLTVGAQLAIPAQGAASAPAVASTADAATEAASAQPATSAAAGPGAYRVAPGDTLSAIAARAGVSVNALAAANGLSPDGILPAGATLSVSGSAAASAASSSVATSTPAAPAATGAQPTGQTVTPSDVGAIADQGGVSPSLAEAIGYQESGFNNAEVSPTGATGVMQIEPGTWSDINGLGGPALAPDSATDNVRGGVELLHSLLGQTGGDPAQAAAAYYQGLQSVRQHGMYADTQRYVDSVMALQQRFGGS